MNLKIMRGHKKQGKKFLIVNINNIVNEIVQEFNSLYDARLYLAKYGNKDAKNDLYNHTSSKKTDIEPEFSGDYKFHLS